MVNYDIGILKFNNKKCLKDHEKAEVKIDQISSFPQLILLIGNN